DEQQRSGGQYRRPREDRTDHAVTHWRCSARCFGAGGDLRHLDTVLTGHVIEAPVAADTRSWALAPCENSPRIRHLYMTRMRSASVRTSSTSLEMSRTPTLSSRAMLRISW